MTDEEAKNSVDVEIVNVVSTREALVNVSILATCFGIGWAMLFVQVSTTPVVAREWVGTAFSVVPYGVLATTHAIVALPSRLMMKALGEKRSYAFGGIMGCLGNIFCLIAAIRRNPSLLCVGGLFCGIANAYFNFLRFEAVRFVSPKHMPMAVSAVVAGGVIGGGLGPIIARFSKNLLPHEFEATYLIAIGLWLCYVGLISVVQFHRVHEQPITVVQTTQDCGSNLEASGTLPPAPRPMLKILSQPDYVLALVSGTTSYSIMATIMLASIVALKAVDPATGAIILDIKDGKYRFADVSNAILIHVEAMFVPSFFTGFLMAAMGPLLSISLGLAVTAGSIFLFLLGTQLWVFFLCLGLLGIGWNLSYVGATALLTTTYTASEKDKAQGLNDCLIFSVNALLTTTAGVALSSLGRWSTFVVVYGLLAVPGLLVAVFFTLRRYLKAAGRVRSIGR